MAIKLTKNELKRQKDLLNQYRRFLPTLLLKKKQLQSVITEYQQRADKVQDEIKTLRSYIDKWVDVYGENSSFSQSIGDFIKVKEIICDVTNIAGVNIPSFNKLEFADIDYDFNIYPLWVDKGIQTLKEFLSLDAKCNVYIKAKLLLEAELKLTTQRVNLFEKVKIPETLENIKKIQVALQDQQTASVVKGKIAKTKLSKVSYEKENMQGI